ncbi:zinc finger protein with KRAB and SCAN domains 1-like [Ptychodera flava]|uniref:zinc finger protein with KRAB and SCAN domains 1-like n=1 Tax=Ptychodera flava TaxID=63121 RepID=UPI00396A6A54
MASFPYQPTAPEQQQCQFVHSTAAAVPTASTHRTTVSLPNTAVDMQPNAWSSPCTYGLANPSTSVVGDVNRINPTMPVQFSLHLAKAASMAVSSSPNMIKVPIPPATQASAFQVQCAPTTQPQPFSIPARTMTSPAKEEPEKSSRGNEATEQRIIPNIKIGQMIRKEKAFTKAQENGSGQSTESKADVKGEERTEKEEKITPPQQVPVAEPCPFEKGHECKPKKKKQKWTNSGDLKDSADGAGSHKSKCKRSAVDGLVSGAEIYICNSCGKQFSEDKHLKRHQMLHSNERQHRCSLCGMAFVRADHQRRHEKTHTGERPYGCNVCSKAFTRASHLKRHKRLHSGDKPYECDECDKAYIDPSHLKRHKLSHIRLTQTDVL